MPQARTKPVEKICPVCKAVFLVCPPRRKSRYYPSNNQIFCSMKCQCRGRYRSGIKCNQLTSEQAAYIAGFLDADGSICLYRRRTKVALRVAFCNCRQNVLDWIVEVSGIGSVVSYIPDNPKHATRFQVQVNAEAALTLLEQVMPYLIRKQEQARLGIEHQHNLSDPALAANSSWQQANYKRMCALNKTGRQSNRQR